MGLTFGFCDCTALRFGPRTWRINLSSTNEVCLFSFCLLSAYPCLPVYIQPPFFDSLSYFHSSVLHTRTNFTLCFSNLQLTQWELTHRLSRVTDNRPVPKPHFAAVTSHVAPSKPANLPSTSAGSLGPRRSFVAHGPRHSLAGPRASIGGLHGPRPSVGGLRGHGPRPSLLPTALVSSSRVPRASLVPAAWGVPAGTSRVPRASNIGLGHGVGGANRRRSSGFGFAGSVGNAGTQALSGMAGLSEKEINEKVRPFPSSHRL